MAYFPSAVVCCFGFVLFIDGLSYCLADSPCGDWTPFKHEKCIKLVDRVGFQTKEDGDIICRAFAEELQSQEIPKLVTIKTKEEQKFLQKLLLEHLGHLDNVWLGLEFGKDDAFHWNDGTDLRFTNWVDGSMTASDRKCVQMESGGGAYERGKWVRINCAKRNAIVCERTQPWSYATLQNIILSVKSEVARNKEEAEQKLIDVKKEAEQKINAVNQQIRSLKNNSVPIGFIYVQLPLQDHPASLWPHTTWKNIGAGYAGLFFRVEGGDAAPFGELQEDNTRRIADVQTRYTDEDAKPQVPSDGSWCKFSWTGTSAPGTSIGVRVRLTKGEVRPQNKAVRLWQRVT